MYGIWKGARDEPVCRGGVETQMKRRACGHSVGGEGGVDGESGVDGTHRRVCSRHPLGRGCERFS